MPKIFIPTDAEGEDGYYKNVDIDYVKVVQYLADEFKLTYSTMSDIIDYCNIDLESMAERIGVEMFI